MEIIMYPEVVKDVKCFGPCITIRNFYTVKSKVGLLDEYIPFSYKSTL